MARYIDADKLIWQVQDSDKYGTITKQVFISLLQNSETADVAPVIHAHWIEIYGGYLCSRCGTEFSTVLPLCTRDRSMSSFCLHCGAKMDEEVK